MKQIRYRAYQASREGTLVNKRCLKATLFFFQQSVSPPLHTVYNPASIPGAERMLNLSRMLTAAFE